MERLRQGGHKFLYSAIFFLIIFTGCATKEAVKSVSDEEVLRDRVMAYWNHKVKEEYDLSYDYEDPFYRKRFNRTKYVKSINIDKRVGWKEVRIGDLKMEGDSATVVIKLRMRIGAPSAGVEQDVAISERWVKVDGLWYHVQKKSMEQQGTN